MSLLIEQKCSYPDEVDNEDYIYSNNNCLIILDGSSNLFSLNKEIDAKWYVKTFIEHFNLLYNDNDEFNLLMILKETVQKMKEQYTIVTGNNPDAFDQKSSAAIALVVEKKGLLHFYSLGDCSIIIDFRSSKKEKELIYMSDVSMFDQLVINKMIEIHNETRVDVIETRELTEIKNMLCLNRGKMNKPDGYWILGFDVDAIDHGIYKTYPSREVNRVIIFSDGFEQQKQKILDSDSFDVEELFKELREQEQKDSGCNKMPRLKKSDDASIIVAKVLG